MEIVQICNIAETHFIAGRENPFVLTQKPNKMGKFEILSMH